MTGLNELTVGVPRGGLSLISWLSDIAESMGFYADEGLAVTSRASSYAELNDGLASGSLPVIRRGPDADLALAGTATGIKVIAGIAKSAVFDIVSHSQLDGLEALKGARIAVIHPRYGSTLALRLAVASVGLSDGDYELVEIGSSPNRLEALHSGRVDATILTLPYRHNGGELAVVTEVATAVPTFVASSIQANVDAVIAGGLQEAVVAYLAATVRAARWLADPGNETAAVDWLRYGSGCSPAMAERSYRLMRDDGLTLDGEIPTEGLRVILDALQRTGDLSEPGDVADYAYTDYLDQARERLS